MMGKLVLLTVLALISAGLARAQGIDVIETRQAGQTPTKIPETSAIALVKPRVSRSILVS